MINSPGVNSDARSAPAGEALGMARIQSRQVDPRFGHQGDESRDEVHRLEDDVRGAIAVRRFKRVAHLSIAQQRQPLFRNRRLRNMPLLILDSLELDVFYSPSLCNIHFVTNRLPPMFALFLAVSD